MRSDRGTTALLLTGPTTLLAGALAFQYLGGLYPCEMCLWQRYALVAALMAATTAWALGLSRALLVVAAVAVLVGAGVALFHAGVEQRWWQGFSECTAPAVSGSAADVMGQILAQPLVRCDAIPWSLLGVSMAGWNAIISGLVGGTALWRLGRERRRG